MVILIPLLFLVLLLSLLLASSKEPELPLRAAGLTPRKGKGPPTGSRHGGKEGKTTARPLESQMALEPKMALKNTT